MKESELFIGIDSGSQKTGFGIIKVETNGIKYINHGVIRLDGEKIFAARLQRLHCELLKIFDIYKPVAVSIEKVFLGSNVDSAFKLGHARGICLAVASQWGCEIKEIAPRSVKKSVTGYGAATKEQVALALSSWLKINTSSFPVDSTDALALAVSFGLVWNQEKLVKKLQFESL